MKNLKILAVTGIDTDIGKTIVTGVMARFFLDRNIRVITQKIVQTGCFGISEDIESHRQIMGIDIVPEDRDSTTCPYVFPVACSPHLAARLEGQEIDCGVIRQATQRLLDTFDLVLLEGAGGLSVPLTADYTTLDYLEEQQYPIVLVSSSRLGSINHTLNALELAKRRNMSVAGIVYNRFEETDPRISLESKEVFRHYLVKYGYKDCVIDFPVLDKKNDNGRLVDFSDLLL